MTNVRPVIVLKIATVKVINVFVRLDTSTIQQQGTLPAHSVVQLFHFVTFATTPQYVLNAK